MTYNMIKSQDFFKTIKKSIESKMNVETLYDEVLSVDNKPKNVKVKTKIILLQQVKFLIAYQILHLTKRIQT